MCSSSEKLLRSLTSLSHSSNSFFTHQTTMTSLSFLFQTQTCAYFSLFKPLLLNLFMFSHIKQSLTCLLNSAKLKSEQSSTWYMYIKRYSLCIVNTSYSKEYNAATASFPRKISLEILQQLPFLCREISNSLEQNSLIKMYLNSC